MDPFAVIILGGTAGLIGALYLLGRFTSGTGAEQLDWKPTRTPEQEAQNDVDDLDQMLEAANRRRRARGKPELTEESLAAEVAQQRGEDVKRRDDYVADLEIEQMLKAKNKRRAARGQEPLTAGEYREQLMGGRR